MLRRAVWNLLPVLAACIAACGGSGRSTPETPGRTGKGPAPTPDTLARGPSAARPVAIPFAVPDIWVSTTTATTPAPSPEPPPDTLPIHPPRDSAGFPARAADDIAGFAPGMTAGAWARTHPEDGLTRFVGEDLPEPGDDALDGPWCVAARRRERLPDGRVLRRSALFYAPAMPDPPTLPPLRSDGRADLDECVLGAIRVEVERDVAEQRGRALALQVRRVLSSQFGVPDTMPPGFWPLRDFRAYSAWHLPDRWIGAGWHRFGDLQAGVWALVSGVRADAADTATAPGTFSAAELAAGSGLEADLRRELLALLERSRSIAQERVPVENWQDSTLLDLLRRWHEALPTLRPEQRTAALILADAVMSHAYPYTGAAKRGGEAERHRLQAVGVRSASFPISSEYGYSGNLLWEAYETAPEGPLREVAMLARLELGLEDDPPCGHGMAQFERVIAEGERALPTVRDPDRLAQLHLLLARAYGDILAVAARIDSFADYVDPAPFRPRAEFARRRAPRHYQAALDRLGIGADGQAAWREGWRLRAGLPPRQTFFVCVYD